MDDKYFYETNDNIRAYEVGFNGKLLLSGVLVRAQEVSEDHGVATGIGREDLIGSRGLCWMILHMRFEADRYPKIADKVKTRTWAYVKGRTAVHRNYVLTSPEGESYFRGSSEWVLYRLNDRKLALPKAIADLWHEEKRIEDLAEDTPRQRAFADTEPFVSHTVTFTDCDMNRHMNNVKYLDTVIDSYPLDFVLTHEIAVFDVTYVNQAAPGEQLDIRKREEGDTHFISAFVGDRNIFNTIIEWRPSV